MSEGMQRRGETEIMMFEQFLGGGVSVSGTETNRLSA